MESHSPAEAMELAGNAFNGGVVSACLTSMMIAVPWPEVFAAPRLVESDCEGEPLEEQGESEDQAEDKSVSTVSTNSDL